MAAAARVTVSGPHDIWRNRHYIKVWKVAIEDGDGFTQHSYERKSVDEARNTGRHISQDRAIPYHEIDRTIEYEAARRADR